MQASDPFGWVGSIIDGQFAVDALAGEGAFGVVYRGRHLGFSAPIAVKCLKIPAGLSPEQREEFLATFREEARLLHQLSRRTMGIVRALDIGAAAAPSGPWTPYIVMEWLDGETLEQDLRRRREERAPPRSLGEAIKLLAPVASALAVAHAENVSHRDVKPANLFLAGEITKVLDFGLAKVFTETPTLTEALAQTGRTFRAFTPQYGAPEQFSPRFGATGPWTDVYAMALILLEVATGEPALSGNDVIQLFVASSDETSRPSLRARGIEAGREMDAVLGRALAINPAHRFHSVGEMWSALESAQRATSIEVARDTLRAPAFDEGEGPGRSPSYTGADGAGRSFLHDVDAGPGVAVRVPPPPALPASWAPRDVGQGVPGQDRVAPSGRAAVPADAASGSAFAVPLEGGEHRVCTVMFADLSEATGLSARLDPEEVKDLIDCCYQALAEQVEKMQGIVEKPSGGRAMAIFGAPRSTEHDAERAIVAALGAQAAIAGLALPRAARASRLAVRIGITTGRVFIGAGGSGRQEVAIIGDAVDSAARLQQLAPRGTIVIGRDTHRLVLGRFLVEPIERATAGVRSIGAPPGEAPARSEELPIYRVLGESPLAHAVAPAEFHGLPTRLVGRTAEMQRLRDVVETALHERRARFVTLVGAPGAGRTRMLADLASSLAPREPSSLAPREPGGAPSCGLPTIDAPAGGLVVLEAQCSALAGETSYELVASLIRRRFGIHERDLPEVIWRKLRRGVRWFRLHTKRVAPRVPSIVAPGGGSFGLHPAAHDDDLEPPSSNARPLGLAGAEDMLASVALILGVQPAPTGSPRAAVRSSATPAVKHRTLAAIFRLVASALDRTPIVLLCDDIQWADDATLDLLDEIVSRADGLPLCVVCAARPDLYERRPRWGAGKETHVRVECPPLARRHVEEMIRDRLRLVPDLQHETIRVLAERAEGSPRTLEETLQLLVDAGVIETQGERWRLHGAGLGDLMFPTTVQSFVQARLDRLDAEALRVLAEASVVGRTFWEGAVERLRQAAPQGRSPVSSQRILAELQDLDPPFSVRHEDGASAAQILERLCERQLIRQRSATTFPGEREYVFVEQSTCEVAYEMLSLKVRRRIHLLVADWIERRALGDAAAALVGHHYDRGGDLRAAAAAYARGAAHAAAVGETAEAERLAERSRAVHDELDAEERQRQA